MTFWLPRARLHHDRTSTQKHQKKPPTSPLNTQHPVSSLKSSTISVEPSKHNASIFVSRGVELSEIGFSMMVYTQRSAAMSTTTSGDYVPKAPSNALDTSAFTPPNQLPNPRIIVEFCDRCRWLHRATWVQTELLLTFPPPLLKAITILPLNADETAGRFRVWLAMDSDDSELPSSHILIWDRKLEGGFPELKVLKQRIRDHVQPEKSLGHSDKKH